MLQQQVTAANTDEQMVGSVAELNDLSTRVFNQVAEVVLEGDMSALERTLNESADALNGLARIVGDMTREIL